MILISGSSEREVVDLQQGDYEEMDQLAIAKPLCKAAFRVLHAATSESALRARSAPRSRAVRAASISIFPPNCFGQVMDAEAGEEVAGQGDRRGACANPGADAVKRALDVLKSAKRPLIILGKGAAYAQADDAIRVLVEKSGIPFLPMSMAKGLLPDTHPQCAGAARSTVLAHVRRRDADRRAPQLAVVARQGQDLGTEPMKKFIQVDIEPKEMDSNVEIVAPVVGDIGSCVAALLQGMGGNWPAPPADWTNAVNAKQRRERFQDGSAADEQQLADGLPRRARRAAHDHQGTARRHPGQRRRQHARSRARDHRHVQAPQASGCRHLGDHGHRHGLCIAAAIETGKPVLAVEGDSAFGFSGMEVETICRYKLPVCIVIFNNDGIYRGTDVNNVSLDPATTVFVKGSRYDKIIEAFGGVGVNVTSPDELSARRERGDGFRQADADQCGDRSGGGQRRAATSANLNPQSKMKKEIKERARTRPPQTDKSASAAQSAAAAAKPARRSTACAFLTFTHVQSGPTCTQLLAYMGADCIKVERPGVGDITRTQLRDVKGADCLYFTMLNANKRSITIDSEEPQGDGNPRTAGEDVRRAGGKFRARRARPHGPDLGARPSTQSAHHHGIGQGLRSGTL